MELLKRLESKKDKVKVGKEPKIQGKELSFGHKL